MPGGLQEGAAHPVATASGTENHTGFQCGSSAPGILIGPVKSEWLKYNFMVCLFMLDQVVAFG